MEKMEAEMKPHSISPQKGEEMEEIETKKSANTNMLF
jgi:hypothetical protein